MVIKRSKQEYFGARVGDDEKRKLRAMHEEKHSEWRGFALFGMVGWSVTVPTLVGAALGIWLDKRRPQHFSWTLTLILAGLLAGCAIAWHWISEEQHSIHNKINKKDE